MPCSSREGGSALSSEQKYPAILHSLPHALVEILNMLSSLQLLHYGDAVKLHLLA